VPCVYQVKIFFFFFFFFFLVALDLVASYSSSKSSNFIYIATSHNLILRGPYLYQNVRPSRNLTPSVSYKKVRTQTKSLNLSRVQNITVF
jgi:hypothetical protein